jgi:Glycosyltransferase WbsX
MNPFAIYFPQYYPTPTNDKAWGHGFTDWSLIANANLRDQWARRAPRRGFYDGADPAVHAAQMEEMVEAGLGGMAVYHYWFYSHQELPAFEHSLVRGRARLDLPWFFIWASEGWSRRWMGDHSSIVALSPEPTPAEIQTHCRYLLSCFEQPSYFKWQGRPLFVWYHLDHFRTPERVLDEYRSCFRNGGLDVAFGHFVKNPFDSQLARLVEVSYLFEPRLHFGMHRAGRGAGAKKAFDAIQRVAGDRVAQSLLALMDRVQQKGQVHSAADHVQYLGSAQRSGLVASLHGTVQDVISPGWNNTPRYANRFTALQDLDPQQFGALVRAASARTNTLPPLINAWNEWSEGAAIEPCAYLGTRYLDALRAPAGERATDIALPNP